jgi:hypothetical protein
MAMEVARLYVTAVWWILEVIGKWSASDMTSKSGYPGSILARYHWKICQYSQRNHRVGSVVTMGPRLQSLYHRGGSIEHDGSL